jgi:hypothetical protein
MLINPLNHDFALRWHRDDVNEKASEEEERNALNVWHYGVRIITCQRFLLNSRHSILGAMECVRLRVLSPAFWLVIKEAF